MSIKEMEQNVSANVYIPKSKYAKGKGNINIPSIEL